MEPSGRSCGASFATTPLRWAACAFSPSSMRSIKDGARGCGGSGAEDSAPMGFSSALCFESAPAVSLLRSVGRSVAGGVGAATGVEASSVFEFPSIAFHLTRIHSSLREIPWLACTLPGVSLSEFSDRACGPPNNLPITRCDNTGDSSFLGADIALVAPAPANRALSAGYQVRQVRLSLANDTQFSII